MKNEKYEGTVGSYVFYMVDDNMIEVWEDTTLEFPESFILLKEGDVTSLKQFQIEISEWFLKNVS